MSELDDFCMICGAGLKCDVYFPPLSECKCTQQDVLKLFHPSPVYRMEYKFSPSEIEKHKTLVNKNGGVFDPKQFETIIDESELSHGSKVGYYNTIKKIIKANKQEDEGEALERLSKKIKLNKQELVTIEKDNKLTVKESLRWMNWDTIKEMYTHMKANMDSGLYKTIRDVERFVLFALYMEIEPLRLDFGSTFIIYNIEIDKLFEKLDKDNLLIINEIDYRTGTNGGRVFLSESNIKSMTFILRHDKVSSKIGPMNIELPSILYKYICTLLNLRCDTFKRHSPGTYLFYSPKDVNLPMDYGHTLHKPNMKRLLASIPALDGSKSNLCVDTIRSARVTELFSKPSTMNEKERVAKLMRTSVHQMMQSYNKIL